MRGNTRCGAKGVKGIIPIDKTAAPRMTARAFIAWQAALGLTDSQAARQLGVRRECSARPCLLCRCSGLV